MVNLDKLDLVAPEDHLALPDHLVHQAHEDLEETRDRPEHRDLQATVDRVDNEDSKA